MRIDERYSRRLADTVDGQIACHEKTREILGESLDEEGALRKAVRRHPHIAYRDIRTMHASARLLDAIAQRLDSGAMIPPEAYEVVECECVCAAVTLDEACRYRRPFPVSP